MKMQVQIPVMVAKLYGRYRNRITHETGLQPLVTTVRAVKKHEMSNGVFDDKMVDVEAFIPIHMRGSIECRPDKWVTPEYFRTVAWIVENKKTLADFMDSDETERRFDHDEL